MTDRPQPGTAAIGRSRCRHRRCLGSVAFAHNGERPNDRPRAAPPCAAAVRRGCSHRSRPPLPSRAAAGPLKAVQIHDASTAQQDVSGDFLIGSRAAWRWRGSWTGNLPIAHVAPWLQNSSIEVDERTFPILAARQEQIGHALKSLMAVGIRDVGAVYASATDHRLYREDVERGRPALAAAGLRARHGPRPAGAAADARQAGHPAVRGRHARAAAVHPRAGEAAAARWTWAGSGSASIRAGTAAATSPRAC